VAREKVWARTIGIRVAASLMAAVLLLVTVFGFFEVLLFGAPSPGLMKISLSILRE